MLRQVSSCCTWSSTLPRYMFTVSEVPTFNGRRGLWKASHIIYNGDVKQLLIDHYGDQIQFAPNKRKYESDQFFSSSIDTSGLASKIKKLWHYSRSSWAAQAAHAWSWFLIERSLLWCSRNTRILGRDVHARRLNALLWPCVQCSKIFRSLEWTMCFQIQMKMRMRIITLIWCRISSWRQWFT